MEDNVLKISDYLKGISEDAEQIISAYDEKAKELYPNNEEIREVWTVKAIIFLMLDWNAEDPFLEDETKTKLESRYEELGKKMDEYYDR
ncbi:MAG: hypothetical protein ACXABY_28925 [Candidatus Thorarchaeota archaeon]|jgi:hypothetical protein